MDQRDHRNLEKVAMDVPLWAVAIIATEKKLPKTRNAKKPEWTEQNIKTMIRSNRVTVVSIVTESARFVACFQLAEAFYRWRRSLGTGHAPSTYRFGCPLVSANKAIDDRRTRVDHKKGPENPMYGVPRDSAAHWRTSFVVVSVETRW